MDIQAYITDKRVSGALEQQLLALDSSDRQAVEQVLDEVSPSANTLRGILQLATEVAARDKCSLAEVLSSKDLKKAIQREGISRKEKQKLLRSGLEQLRYPMVAQLQTQLERAATNLRTQCGLRVELPKDMEGDALEFHVSARSLDELRELGKKFEQAAQSDAAHELFEVLRGEF